LYVDQMKERYLAIVDQATDFINTLFTMLNQGNINGL